MSAILWQKVTLSRYIKIHQFSFNMSCRCSPKGGKNITYPENRSRLLSLSRRRHKPSVSWVYRWRIGSLEKITLFMRSSSGSLLLAVLRHEYKSCLCKNISGDEGCHFFRLIIFNPWDTEGLRVARGVLRTSAEVIAMLTYSGYELQKV